MSYFERVGQYILPWEAWPNMRRDLSEASHTSGKDKHKSIYGAIGKYADPAGALLGDRWMNFWHERLPEKVNETLEPVGHFNRKYMDPIARMVPEDSKWQRVPDFVEAKGGDSLATVLLAIFGGGAALGAAGGGGAGGGGAAAGGAAAGGGGAAAGGGGSGAGGAVAGGGGGLGSGSVFGDLGSAGGLPGFYGQLAQGMPGQGLGNNNAAAIAAAQRAREEEARRKARERAELLAMVEASQMGSQAGLGSPMLRLYS